jgi:site-specific DNA-methyltransferase (adenine-specific)
MNALPYRVIHGDCLEVLRRWKSDSVTAIVGDAPYSEHCHGNMRGNRGRNIEGQKKIAERDPGFLPLTLEELRLHSEQFARVATQWIALFSDDVTLPLWREGIEDAKGHYTRTIPWVRWSCPNFSGMCPPSGAEFVAIARPRKFPGKTPKARKWLKGNRTHYDIKCLRAKSDEKKDLEAWSKDPEHPGHRAQKPIGLMIEVLSDCCKAGDIIVDPYAGSGTTGIAALRLGMRVVLIEKNEQDAQLCQARMDREWARLQQAK